MNCMARLLSLSTVQFFSENPHSAVEMVSVQCTPILSPSLGCLYIDGGLITFRSQTRHRWMAENRPCQITFLLFPKTKRLASVLLIRWPKPPLSACMHSLTYPALLSPLVSQPRSHASVRPVHIYVRAHRHASCFLAAYRAVDLSVSA